MSKWAQFPRARFVDEAKASQQFKHLESEIREVKASLKKFSANDVVEELFDVIHSAETLIRMIENEDRIDANKLKEKVIRKNQERGYYD